MRGKKAVNNVYIKHIANKNIKINYFLISVVMIGLGYSTYCLWQAHSGAAGCPVEIECSEDDMEADSLGILLKQFNMET